MGITTAQTLLKTRVVITEQPGPWTASPSARRAVCIGDDGCTDNSGTATLQFSYETPAGCYSDVACSTTPDTACGATSVVVRPEGGSEDDDSAPENDGVFTTTLNVGDTSPRYAVYGVSETGLVSTKLECSADTGVFYVEPVECVCGKPPEISLDDQEIKYGETGTGAWAVNRAISVNFKLEDEDITNPDTLPSSVQEIKMFFTTDGGATTHFVDAMTNTRSRLDSTGSFTAEIPAEYVTGESDIFFAVIATDEDGLEGVYPPGFYCYSDTSCDWTAKDTFMVIPTDAVVEDTNLHFTKEPFPNQLPFRAGPDSLLKIYFNMSGEADVTMRIYSMDGALIRQVGSDRNTQLTSSMERSDCTGEACNFCNYATGCAWDGTNMGGAENYVTNGMYVVNIHASGDGILAGQEYDYTKAVVVMK